MVRTRAQKKLRNNFFVVLVLKFLSLQFQVRAPATSVVHSGLRLLHLCGQVGSTFTSAFYIRSENFENYVSHFLLFLYKNKQTTPQPLGCGKGQGAGSRRGSRSHRVSRFLTRALLLALVLPPRSRQAQAVPLEREAGCRQLRPRAPGHGPVGVVSGREHPPRPAVPLRR